MAAAGWVHIGDGVYVWFDGDGWWLHANDHESPTDRIYLEPEVAIQLARMIVRIYPVAGK